MSATILNKVHVLVWGCAGSIQWCYGGMLGNPIVQCIKNIFPFIRELEVNKRPKLNSYALTGIFKPVRSTVSNRFQLFYTQKHILSAHSYFVVIFVCLFVNEDVRFRKNEGVKCFLNKNKTKRIVTVHPSVDVLLLFFNKSTMSTTMPDLPFTSFCPFSSRALFC